MAIALQAHAHHGHAHAHHGHACHVNRARACLITESGAAPRATRRPDTSQRRFCAGAICPQFLFSLPQCGACVPRVVLGWRGCLVISRASSEACSDDWPQSFCSPAACARWSTHAPLEYSRAAGVPACARWSTHAPRGSRTIQLHSALRLYVAAHGNCATP